MREAGLLTTGARGVNAPEMAMKDVARLTLALMTGEPPSKVVEEYRFIASLQTVDLFPVKGWISSNELFEGHSFEEAVIEVFEAMNDNRRRQAFSTTASGLTHPPSTQVYLDSSRRVARLELYDVSAEYTNLAGQRRLAELYATRPMTLEAWKQIEVIEVSGATSYDSSMTVPGRGMRVIRSITQDEVFAICSAIQSEAVHDTAQSNLR